MLTIISLFVFAALIGVKLYMKLTTGMCKSKCRLDGKTAIVTGANTGIGKETARDFAIRGAKVILACRDMKKAKEAQEDLIKNTGNINIVTRYLDLSSLASVRAFVKETLRLETRLDILVNNAGAGALGNHITADNLNINIQVNHLGPFLLTVLLLGLLKKSAPSRIVVVSSILHHYAKFDLENLNSEKWFDHTQVYANSKLANVMFANELCRKLKGTGVTVNSLHPGTILTDIFRNIPSPAREILHAILRLFCKNVTEGAQTTIYLAVSEEVTDVSGKYFSDCKEANMASAAKDEALVKKLWEKNEILVGLKPEEIIY